MGGVTIDVTSKEASQIPGIYSAGTYNLNTDVYGLARLKITLNPGEYNITYKYSNTYYNLFASGSNRISVYKTPTSIFAKDLVINKGESRILDIELMDVNNHPIKNNGCCYDINYCYRNINN